MLRPGLLVAATAVAVTCLDAQTIHTVGGANPSFATLVDALASPRVGPGDTLLIRRGTYDAPDIQKAVTVIGESDVFLRRDFRQTQVVKISGIGLGHSLVIENIRFITSIYLVNCAGRVHLGRVDAVSLNIEFCPAVSIREFTTGGGVGVESSALSCTSCELWGVASLSGSRPGLAVRNQSRVVIAGGRILGAPGFGTIFNIVPPTAAVTCADSEVTVSRDTTATGGALSGFSASALQGLGTAAHLRLDPRAVLTPTGSAPAVTGFASVTQRRPPVVISHGGEVGLAAGVDLLASNGDVYLVLVSGFGGRPFPVAPFGGEAWLDVGSMQILDGGVVPASDEVKRTWTTPNNPALRGGLVTIQGLAGPASGPVDFSNPGVFVIR